MIPPYQVGDIVKLRSGGASMTVEEVVDSHQVKCVWIDEVGQPHRSSFVIATLELVD